MIYDQRREELFTIKDDVVDPSGVSGLSGRSYDIHLDHGKYPVPIRWRDRVTEADVYELPDRLLVHMYCPRCTRCLKIESIKKRVVFTKGTGRIDIDRIRCSYENCDWSVVVENNIAKDV